MTGRLLYSYDPENEVAIGDGEPIRDIAAIWDVEVEAYRFACLLRELAVAGGPRPVRSYGKTACEEPAGKPAT
jgi:hypothetical protein